MSLIKSVELAVNRTGCLLVKSVMDHRTELNETLNGTITTHYYLWSTQFKMTATTNQF